MSTYDSTLIYAYTLQLTLYNAYRKMCIIRTYTCSKCQSMYGGIDTDRGLTDHVLQAVGGRLGVPVVTTVPQLEPLGHVHGPGEMLTQSLQL